MFEEKKRFKPNQNRTKHFFPTKNENIIKFISKIMKKNDSTKQTQNENS